MYRYGIVVIGYKNETGIRRLLNALQTADYGNNTVLFIISIDKSDNNIIKKIADQSVSYTHLTLPTTSRV